MILRFNIDTGTNNIDNKYKRLSEMLRLTIVDIFINATGNTARAVVSSVLRSEGLNDTQIRYDVPSDTVRDLENLVIDQETKKRILRELMMINLQLRGLMSEKAEIEGIHTREQYIDVYSSMNQLVRYIDLPEFMQEYLSIALRPNEQLPRNRILIKCADGRTSSVSHFVKRHLLQFKPKIRPSAGLVISGKLARINYGTNDKGENIDSGIEVREILNNPNRKRERKGIFDEIEKFLGRQLNHRRITAQASTIVGKIVLGQITEFDGDSITYNGQRINIPQNLRVAIIKILQYSADSIDKSAFSNTGLYEIFKKKVEDLPISGYETVIELQSHTDPTNGHGCGRWGCDNKKALQMTAINALFIEAFLQERYPDLVIPGSEQVIIIRTNHETGKNERIVSALETEKNLGLNPLLSELVGNKFIPRYFKYPSKGIVREKVIDESADTVHTEEHDEQTILITAHPKSARFKQKVSKLEQTMLPDKEEMYGTIWKLIGIIQNNRIKRKSEEGKDEPIIIHLDSPNPVGSNNNEVWNKVILYDDIYHRLNNDEKIKELIKEGKLIIVRSITNGFDITDEQFNPESAYETIFLNENNGDKDINFSEFIEKKFDVQLSFMIKIRNKLQKIKI